MKHSYVRSNYGCNCFYGDSAFKRYNRAHGDTLIFNYNYGNAGYCCGGSRGIGFKGGFGFGVGAVIGQYAMNFLNNLLGGISGGNWAWNNGGGNVMPWAGSNGGGYQFGNTGWNPWSNNGNNTWNPWGNKQYTPFVPQKKDDVDNQKIADFITEINALEDGGTPDKAKIEELKTRIKEAIKYADDIQKEADLKSYNGLLKRLDKLGSNPNTTPTGQPLGAQSTGSTPVNLAGGNGEEVANDPSNSVVKNQEPVVNQSPAGAVSAEDNGAPAEVVVSNNVAAGEIKIGGTTKPIKDIDSVDDLAGLTRNNIENLDPKVAIEVLDNLGYTEGTGNNKVGKLSNNFAVLLLLEASKLEVQVENRNESQDQWIKGPISNVQNDDVISYDVDCEGVQGALYEAKYTFTQSATIKNEYTCKLAKDSKNKVFVDSGIKLKFIGEGKALENESGMPLVTK